MTTTALYRKYQKAYWACMTQGLPAEERKKIYNKMTGYQFSQNT